MFRYFIKKRLLKFATIFFFLYFCIYNISQAHRAYEKKFIKTDKNMQIGEKIAFYANEFIDTPYDRIPIGLYVDSKRLIADYEVDCMYLVFRVVSLAIANGNNKKSKQIACDKMFHDKCILDNNGFVMNYENRFDYSEDMIASGKWGKSVFTNDEMETISGTRMYEKTGFYYMPSKKFLKNNKLQKKIKKGDIIFLFKKPELRSKAQELIGHLGILDVVDGENYFIHASGSKNFNKEQGKVKKVLLNDYLRNMNKFIGIYISRM